MSITLPQKWAVACHTDQVGLGSTYVAIRGQNIDGAQFIGEAVSRGAQKIVVGPEATVEYSVRHMLEQKNIPLIVAENDVREELAYLSSKAYNYPHQKLTMIGITGTKGKTTTACVAFHLLREAGYSVALTSTVYNRINDHFFDAPLTTPHADYLHMFLAQCVKRGVTHVVMEVSAQASTLHRIDTMSFDIGVFTNIDHEHGEFYPLFKDYFDAKIAFIKQVKKDGMLLLNADDVRVAELKKEFLLSETYSVHNESADWYASLSNKNVGVGGSFCVHNVKKASWSCPTFQGTFNGSNILAALAIALRCGVKVQDAVNACKTVPPIPGRFEQYDAPSGARYIIDYAHTPASYTLLLSLLRKQTDHLIVLFGAGGARDHSKRPIMGAIAAKYADIIVLTSDNPRQENPIAIIQDIMAHMSLAQKNKVIIEVDREKAIKETYKLSKKNSIIALLGKGPDEFQIVGAKKSPFSEKKIIKQLR